MENNNNKKNSVFYSYNLNPQIDFETHGEDEKIVLLLRSHPFTQISWILNSIFLFVLVFVLNFFIQGFFNLFQTFILNIFAMVFVLNYIWIGFLGWYFNVGIVTNKRVIDIDLHAVIYKEVTDAQLGKIEDITLKRGGYFQSFLDYGTIFIQTAGTIVNIEFHNVPRPTDAIQVINKLLSKKHGV